MWQAMYSILDWQKEIGQLCVSLILCNKAIHIHIYIYIHMHIHEKYRLACPVQTAEVAPCTWPRELPVQSCGSEAGCQGWSDPIV